MNITLIIGFSPKASTEAVSLCNEIAKELQNSGHNTTVFNIENLDFKPCTGCWSCWVKIPGLCGTADESGLVLKAYLHSDLVIFCTNLPAGFISSSTKKVIDKLIPHYHPYILLKDGEMDHFPRYEKYPALASVFIEPLDADQTDIQIADSYMRRVASQFHSAYKFTLVNPISAEELYLETNMFAKTHMTIGVSKQEVPSDN